MCEMVARPLATPLAETVTGESELLCEVLHRCSRAPLTSRHAEPANPKLLWPGQYRAILRHKDSAPMGLDEESEVSGEINKASGIIEVVSLEEEAT